MDLKRYSLGIQYDGHWPEIDEEHDQERGDWVLWADVLAWRDSIRAAVEAEREATPCRCTPPPASHHLRVRECVAALDALLSEASE